jgi:transposase
MSGLDWLSDEAWAVIEPHLPKRPAPARIACAIGDDQRHSASAALRVPLARLSS